MPIRWDALLARHTARELDGLLRGERVRALRLDGEARDLVLILREHTLLWRLHPLRGYVRLLAPLEPAAGDLRLKASLAAIEAVPDERVIRVALAPTGSGRRPLSLLVELLGNQWNAVVTEGEADVVRHVLWRRTGERGPRVGDTYRPPRPVGRDGVGGEVSRAEWVGRLAALPEGDRGAALVREFAWTSPLNADALLGSAAGSGAGPEGERAEGERADGASALQVGYARWKRMAGTHVPSEPVVCETRAGPQPYPFPLAGIPCRPVESLLAAFEACVPRGPDEPYEAPVIAAPLGSALMRRLERTIRRAARREGRLGEELSAVEDPEALRRVGDLILARYREVPRGASKARLTDLEGGVVEVELDPASAPHENAARYYARAAKAERARESLPGLVEQARAERLRLEALLTEAREGALGEDRVREELGPEEPTVRGQVTGPALPYRTFRSSGGLEIRVGRGARHNDDLTFRHSSPGDVWLHARHTAGAHVILRWPGPGKAPARDLEEAATLAALHSKARTSGSVPVDWTLRKHVRKPRRAGPGRVVAERVETLFVEPDPALLDSLDEGR